MATELKRSLNLFDTIMLVSGSMIGSGIFIVSAEMTRTLGSPFWVLMCWLISGVITLFAALSYGELAGMMPEAGGQFIYLKRAFGKKTAFVYGWTVFMVIQTGVIAAVAVAFARYVGVFLPFFDESNVLFSISGFSVFGMQVLKDGFSISTTQVLGVASVVFLTRLNSLGIKNGKIIQRFFTSAKILALLGLIVVGLIAGSRTGFWSENMQIPFSGGQVNGETTNSGILALAGLMGVALIGALFSSDAWNNVTFIAGEIKEPRKNIPLGLFTGVLIVTLLYILANVAYFMLLPSGSALGGTVLERGVAYAQNDRVGTAAIFPLFGNVSVYLMALLIIISTFGCNNGLILQGARLFQAMAGEGLFFKSAASINKYQVPSSALWMQAAWTSVLCFSGSYGSLLEYCTFASLIFYIITIIGLFYLRHTEPQTHRPYKAFGYPVIPALYIIVALFICLALLINKPQNSFLGLLIMFMGLPVYYFFNKRKNTEKLY